MVFKSEFESLIQDTFVLDGQKYAVLKSDDLFNDELKNKLFLAILKISEVGQVLVSVPKDEYDAVAEYYYLLKSAFLKDGEQ